MRLGQSIKEILRNPFHSLIFLLLFLVPLVMSNNTRELFEFPKMFLVYFAGLGLFSLLLTYFVLKKPKIIWPSIPVIIFIISNIVSTIFSSHLYTSFWGYYTRFNDGLLSILVFALVYFVCKNRLKLFDYVALMKASAATVLPIGLIGIMQHFGWETVIMERVYSTLGQPNWLAQYLIMILPFILYLFVIEFSFIWGLTFVIGFSCLWFTYSISGVAGFITVTLFFLAVGIYKELFSKVALGRFIGIYLICFFIAISNPGLFQDKIADSFKDLNKMGTGLESVDTAENRSVSDESSSKNTDYKISDPGFIRLGLWRGSIDLFLSSPKIFLLGTGPETFPYSFQPFREESLNYSSEWDFVLNKPHNYYLEILTETGLIGFTAYMFLLFLMAKKLPFYMLPGLAGLIVTNLFGWPVVSTALLFWVWLGWSEAK